MIGKLWQRLFGMKDVTPVAGPIEPSLTVAALTFSDGTRISLKPDDVVMFVGPNNSGKSMALRQIEWNLDEPRRFNVISSCEDQRDGSDIDFKNYVKSKSQSIFKYDDEKYVGYKYEFRVRFFPSFSGDHNSDIRDFFVLRCSTDDRLTGSDPIRSISYRKEQPSHPIHLLVMDREIEKRISNNFNSAFGQYVYVSRAGGSEVSLYVGNKPIEELPDDPFSAESVEFFSKECHPIKNQGDGMRSFVTLALNSLAISQQTVLLIDEPEAFLHPPQARLIGRLIVSECERKRQTFIATHSSDVLKGVIENTVRNVHILRITRHGNTNIISKLDPKLTVEMSNDPLIRFSGIFDGIFYRHVILCESDTDCQFYGSLLDAPDISGVVRPDVLFVQTSGKHRMAKLGKVATQLGVPYSTIVDVDVLNDKTLFKNLVEAANIPWVEVEKLWKSVFDSINAQRVRLTAAQLITTIEESVEKLRRKDITAVEFLSDVRDRIKSNSPWDAIKRSGRSALPMGEIVQNFDDLLARCGKSGLWIVPVGELEGFCRSVKSRKGSEWIAELLETNDLRTSPELADARAFVASVWRRVEMD
jgi:hypothetical protein